MRFRPVGPRSRLRLFCLLAPASLVLAACQSATDSKTETAASRGPAPVVSPSVDPVAQPGGSLVLVPGKSLGPISVDMEEKDLRALGMEIGAPGGDFLKVGPYLVVMKSGRVESVSVEFPKVAKSVTIGEKTIDQTMTLEAAAATVGNCGAPEHKVGGSRVECRGGTLSVTRGGRSEIITSVEISKAQ